MDVARVRRAVPNAAQARKNFTALAAPVRGWIENENLAANQGAGCSVLENLFPTSSSVRVRGGSLLKTSVGAHVYSLMAYRSGATEQLFAATAAAIVDISLFPSTAGLPAWTQASSGRWSTTQIAIAGAEYLIAVNGLDLAIYYDGTSWNPITTTDIKQLSYDGLTQAFVVGRTVTGGTSGATGTIVGVIPTSATTGRLKLASVSGSFQNDDALTTSGTAGGAATANGVASTSSTVTASGVSTSALSHVWQHRSRIWFIEGGTTKAWYAAIDSIGGTLTSFDFGGLLSQGGSLLFGATWSSDSGSGFADRNVFVSDQGEIVVFDGVDPSSSSTWSLTGHYQVGRPISTQTWQAGGDLIIATEDGMVAMSAVASVDQSALSKTAITYNIEPSWRRNNGSNTTAQPVQLLKWQAQSMGLVGWPHRLGTDAFVVNLITGAWAKWTGLDIQCMALHRGLAYFANTSGEVYQFEAAGYDGTAPYICRMSWLPQHLGAPGAFKSVTQVRATFRSLVPFKPKLSVAENYGKKFPAAPSAPLDTTAEALWDVGVWDLSMWDDSPSAEERLTAITQWVSAGAAGYAVSPQLQITAGGARMLDAELVAYDVAYLVGGYVV